MTDATAGRGGVGIRLYVNGGETVRRTFDQVGDSGKKMWAEIALGQRSANPALRALSAGVGEAKTGVDGLVAKAGPAGSILGAFGAAGVAAAVAVSGLAGAMTTLNGAMTFAADLTDTADRIGVNVERLQAWRFVADEAGVSTEGFQSDLEKLNGSLGKIKAGIGDGRLKPWLEELGITPEALSTITTADEMMVLLAERLGTITDRSKQVAAAKAFGVEGSLPILRLGADRVRELMEEARTLGLVLNSETVVALDEADRAVERASQRINSQMRFAVAGLADDFANLVTQIAGALMKLNEFLGGLGGTDAKMRAMYGFGIGDLASAGFDPIAIGTMLGRAGGAVVSGRAGRVAGAWGQPVDEDDPMIQRGREAAARQRRQANTPDTPDQSSRNARPNRASSVAREEGQRQRERDRALGDLQRQELDAQREAIRARYGPGGTEENATELQLATIQIEQEAQVASRQALRAMFEKAGALNAEVEVRLAALKDAHDELAKAKDNAALLEERQRLAAERLENEQGADQHAIDLLSIQEQMAGTARERYEIGRRILLAEQELERKILEAKVNEKGGVTPYEQNELDRQAQRHAGQTSLFDGNEQNRLRENFRSYGREIVDAIESGRIGETIGAELKARLLDGALDQLFNLMSGGGTGGKTGGGGFWNTVLSVGTSLFGGGGSGGPSIAQKKGGGRAAGGDVRDGFSYRMAEHGPELLLLGSQGQVTNAATTAQMFRDIGPGAGDARGAKQPPVQINMPPITINAQGADAAGLARVERAVGELNSTLEQRAVDAVRDAQDRRFF